MWPRAKDILVAITVDYAVQWYLKLHYYTEGHLRSSIVQGCKYLYDLEMWASLKANTLYHKTFQFVQKKQICM